jgi:hypothetical protein
MRESKSVDKKQAGKSARIVISRETYQKLKELAGGDISPGSYLDKIVDDLARVKREKRGGEILPAGIPCANELTLKLDNIAGGIERLTHILLENQKYAGSMGLIPNPMATNATWQGQVEEYESSHSKYSNGFVPPKQERPHSNPPAHSSDIGRSHPSLQMGRERRGEEDIEEKIRSYEAENPW